MWRINSVQPGQNDIVSLTLHELELRSLDSEDLDVMPDVKPGQEFGQVVFGKEANCQIGLTHIPKTMQWTRQLP